MILNARYRNTGSMRGRFVLRACVLFAVFLPVVSNADAEIRKLWIEIRDSQDQPIEGIRVKCRGYSELSYRTTPSGLAELPLPPGLQPGDEIEIELEPGTGFAKEWTFLKPFSGGINVPNPKQRYYRIVLVRRDYLETMLKSAPTSFNKGRELKIDQFDGPPELGH
jgi:hypothetical protein